MSAKGYNEPNPFFPDPLVFLKPQLTQQPRLTVFDEWDHKESTLLRMPRSTRLWLLFMGTSFILGLPILILYALSPPDVYSEVPWIWASIILHHALSLFLYFFGSEPLKVGQVSIDHLLFWGPLSPYLLYRVQFRWMDSAETTTNPWYMAWLIYVTTVIVLSTVMDAKMAYVYLTKSPNSKQA